MLCFYYLKKFIKYIKLLNFFYYKAYILAKCAYNSLSFFFALANKIIFKSKCIKQKKIKIKNKLKKIKKKYNLAYKKFNNKQ